MKKCLLCVQPAEAQAPWDLEWDKKCTESICDLLTLEHAEHLIFFENVAYCRPCHKFIRDIDFTVRALALFKKKALELRTILAQKLLPHFETWSTLDSVPDECSPIATIHSNESSNLIVTNTNQNSTTGGTLRKGGEPENSSEKAAEDSNASDIQDVQQFCQMPIVIDLKEDGNTGSSSEFENCIRNTRSNTDSDCESLSESEEWPNATQLETLQNKQIVTILDLKEEDDTRIVNSELDSLSTKATNTENSEDGYRRSLRIRKKPVIYQAMVTSEESESDCTDSNEETDSESEFESESDNDLPTESGTQSSSLLGSPPLRRKSKASRNRKRDSRHRNRQKQGRDNNPRSRRRKPFPTGESPVCNLKNCIFEADSSDWLDLHKSEHYTSEADCKTDKTSPCTICNLGFTPDNLQMHLNRVHRPVSGLPTHIQCPGCLKTFGRGKVLKHTFRKFQAHFKSVHVLQEGEAETRSFPYLCPVTDCHFRFRTSKTLTLHTRKYHEDEAEEFLCSVCRVSFCLSSECKTHEELHLPHSFICVLGYCRRNFLRHPNRAKDHGNAETLRTHVREKHPTEKIFKCEKCTFTCVTNTRLTAHQQQMHSEIRDKNICGVNGCTFESESSDWLNVHKTEHQISSDDGAPCSVCQINFTAENLDAHMYRVHCPTTGLPSHIQCPACSKKFGNGKVQRKEFREFQMHFQGVHVERDPETDTRRFPFLCPVRDCRSRARTKEGLAVHNRKCHENDPKPFKCDKCPQSFSQGNLLRQHKSRCHDSPVAVCHLCGKGFANPAAMNYHIAKKHPDAPKYPCNICGAKFNFSIDCKVHEELHQPKSFICVLTKCYERFWTKKPDRRDYGSVERLREHVEEEHQFHQSGKGKVIFCDKCTYTCRLQTGLENHMRKHSKEKPFQCKTCQKCFKSKITLDQHEENKHPDPNNVKVYKCKLCPDTFHSIQFMTRHLYWHRHGSITKPLPKKRPVEGDEVKKVTKKRKRKASVDSESSTNQADSAVKILQKKREEFVGGSGRCLRVRKTKT